MKKNKPRWIHYGEYPKFLKPPVIALCGKGVTHEMCYPVNIIAKWKPNVTCPRCIEAMKLQFWHCEEHGFIPDEEVNNDETCETCGRPVSSENEEATQSANNQNHE
jgi:hypothetical protein